MNINTSMGNILLNRPFTGGMLKSTRERMERVQERDNVVAFYENRLSALKNMRADSLEEINRKLELFQMYQDGIAEARQEYNRNQIFHVLDEAREQGEKIAEAADDRKPKTAEEHKEDMIEEALGIKGQSEGSSIGDILDSAEEMADMAEEMREEAPPEESDENILLMKDEKMTYKPIDYYA